MRAQTIISAFITVLLISFLFISCQENKDFMIGKWEIESVGTSNSEDMLPVTILSMLSVGGTIEFTEQGVFKTKTTKGEYSFSSDDKTVTLKEAESEHIFELNKVSENKLKLQSTSSSLVINLVKK